MEWPAQLGGGLTMGTPHGDGTVGPWAIEKLNALGAYLAAYNTALKKRPEFTRVYVDGFAGLPAVRVRRATSTADAETPRLADLVGPDDDEPQLDQLIAGSAARALALDPGFHRHAFIDRSPARIAALEDLKAAHPDARIVIHERDANDALSLITRALDRRQHRGVAFLDPYGAQLDWSAVDALARTGAMEVIINLPVGMALNRLIGRDGEVIAEARLTAVFGGDEWRDRVYRTEHDLFGEPMVVKSHRAAELLLGLYLSRLKSVFAHVASPRLIRNTRGAPLYFLLWAGHNPIGARIANHVFGSGEVVDLKRLALDVTGGQT